MGGGEIGWVGGGEIGWGGGRENSASSIVTKTVKITSCLAWNAKGMCTIH